MNPYIQDILSQPAALRAALTNYASSGLETLDLEEFDRYGLFFTEQFQIFLEDGFKFVGVATWLLYFARYGYQKIVALTTGNPIPGQGR